MRPLERENRSRDILDKTGASPNERTLYARGADRLDGEALTRVEQGLNASLAATPRALDAAKRLLARSAIGHNARPRHRVLVVGEEQDELSYLASALEACALEVNTFPDALAALAAIRDRSVDVVICDYNMQHMSGVDLIERIREAQPTIAFIRTVSANQIGRVAAHKIAAYPASAGLEDFGSAVLEAIEESSKISG